MRAKIPSLFPDDHKYVYESEDASDCNTSSAGNAKGEGGQLPATTQMAEFIDAKAAAVWLGIPLRSFHQYVQQGFLPSYKLGRHRLFRKRELLATLSINRTASRDEVLR